MSARPKHLIYALVDPRDGRWRYVGKSSSGLARPRAHGGIWQRKNEGHLPVHRWISKLHDSGLEYEVLVLEEVAATVLAKAEAEWISACRRQGVDLLNLTDGGDGAPGYCQSDETRAKRSRSLSFLVRAPKAKKVKPATWRTQCGGYRAGAPKGRAVVDNLGRQYASCGAASKELEVDRALIRRVAQGRKRSVRGRTFHYVEEM